MLGHRILKRGFLLVAVSITLIALPSNGAAQLSPRMTFRTITPCRVVDTRLSAQRFADAEVKGFAIYGSDLSAQGGSPTGCGLSPTETRALAVNLVAINPSGAGNLKAWSTDVATEPITSVLNFQQLTPNLNIANQVTLAVSASDSGFAFNVKASRAVDLVADVVGYFTERPSGYLEASDSTLESADIPGPDLFFFPLSFSFPPIVADGWAMEPNGTFVAEHAGLYLVRYGASPTEGEPVFRIVVDGTPVPGSAVTAPATFERSAIVQMGAGSALQVQFSPQPGSSATISNPNGISSRWIVITPVP